MVDNHRHAWVAQTYGGTAVATATLNGRTVLAIIHYDILSAPPITKDAGMYVTVSDELLDLPQFAFDSFIQRIDCGRVASLIRREYEEANQ